jgi:hypothetical protein
MTLTSKDKKRAVKPSKAVCYHFSQTGKHQKVEWNAFATKEELKELRARLKKQATEYKLRVVPYDIWAHRECRCRECKPRREKR